MRPGALALTDAHPAAPLSKTASVESRKDKAQGVIMVGYRGADIFSPDRYVLQLIDEASSDLGSRFFIRIREQMGLAYYVGASQMEGLVPGLFAFYLGTDPQKIEPVKTALLDEIRKLATDGLTNEELARAKKKLIGQQEIANQSNDSFGYQCALDELYGLGFNYYTSLQHNLPVSLDDIKRWLRKYFRDQPYVLATCTADARQPRQVTMASSDQRTERRAATLIEFVMTRSSLSFLQDSNRSSEGEVNLEPAKMFIDAWLIREKTRGNQRAKSPQCYATHIADGVVEVAQEGPGVSAQPAAAAPPNPRKNIADYPGHRAG
jgi:hypothetical protein